ncbi:putative WRKY transcription factor 41 [Ananas comosus]|uniref:Putative WRKY transcription factor 41 n=1 Tax=Ananas comosus TaxID=4615 RepID=A0A199VM16_ANACO|nr:putative WRKY transcription factor 41 [Ananas comosus]
MKNESVCDVKTLLNVLSQGEEQTLRLEACVGDPDSAEMCRHLARQTHSLFQQAAAMARLIADSRQQPSSNNNNNNTNTAAVASDSPPRSGSGSPTSESSERASKEQERREMSKKSGFFFSLICDRRKTLPRWTNQVRVTSGGSSDGGGVIEGTPDDGYSWRKYGQKDILGAKFPRGYYRCTHRNSYGCLATKQVQRSDEDPSVFDITYRGGHTCLQRRRPTATAASAAQEPGMLQMQDNRQLDPNRPQEPHCDQNELLLSFRQGLKVKTEGLIPDGEHGLTSSSFSFPSTPVSNFASTFSPTFISPTTSESNYFSMSPCQMSNFGRGPTFLGSESELTDLISGATSVANSPMVDIDFVLEPANFEPSFPSFDSSNFFR